MRAPGPVPALVAVCLGWGTIPVTAAATGLPAPAVTAGRVWLAALAFAGVALGRSAGAGRVPGRRPPQGPAELGGRPGPVGRLPARALAAAAGTLLAVHWTLQFAAYERAPAPAVAFVIFLAPIGYAALGPAVLGEPTTWRGWMAVAAAVPGALLVTGAGGLSGPAGTGLALAGASAVALVGLTLVAKHLTLAAGAARAARLQLGVAAAVLAPFAVHLLAGGYGRPRPEWAWLVVLGLVHTAAFVTVYLWALGRVPVATVGVLAQLEPVGVTAVAALQGRLPGLATVAGGAIIVAAGVLAASARPAPSPEVPLALPR